MNTQWIAFPLSVIVALGGMRATSAATGTDNESADQLAEVVVSAQKHQTELQTTPIAISVLDGDDLADRHIQSLADLMTGGIPSLRVAPFFSRSSALTVGIRGIVPFDANQPSRDAGVGVYVDGVYLGRSQGLGSAMYDVERIEVLKGPQGTLFGRNATGGAVNIVTRKPTGQFQIRQSVDVGSFGGIGGRLHADFNRRGNLAFKVDGVYARRNGNVQNPLQGEADFNQYERRGLHLGTQWRASDAFTADYSFDISHDATTPYYVQLLAKNPAAPALAPLVLVQSDRATVADIGVPKQESIGRTHGHLLNLSWALRDGLELRSISSWRKLDQTQYDNGGAHTSRFTPNARFSRYSLASLRQSQYSQELQMLGTLPRLTYVAGAYYYHENGDDDAWTPNTLQWNATGTGYTRLATLAAGQQVPFPDRASNATADSLAAFGQATLSSPGDRLHVTAGARYTHDRKGGVLYKVNGADTAFAFSRSWSRFDPALTLAYDVSDDVHVYGKWGTAYRAGGANSRSVNYRAFDPETVDTIEAGAKTEFWNRRARVNVAAYATRYKDIQIDFSAVNLNSSNRGTLETVNAPGHGTIRGFEVDASLMPSTGTTVSVGYARTTARLPQAANPFNNGALQDVHIVYTPENAWSASLDREWPLGTATLRAHLDGNFADGYRSSSSEATLTDRSTVFNARLAISDLRLRDSAKVTIALWSRNLLNGQHTFYESNAAFAGIGSFGMYNEPRTVGLEAIFTF